ncbi:MAG: hypothetical protein JNK21_05815 [Rhodospirillaceae bacterium]|nr:hypothetical protein [Rhodospirillaceae bacterium]
MKKAIVLSIIAAFAAPSLALAQEDASVRLAKLEEIVVTAEKQQPANYKADAKTEALLAEIAAAK